MDQLNNFLAENDKSSYSLNDVLHTIEHIEQESLRRTGFGLVDLIMVVEDGGLLLVGIDLHRMDTNHQNHSS